MSYTRDEVRAVTDKVLSMAKADAVEVAFDGGERAACRYANSSITANLVERDQQVRITVHLGEKSATVVTHEFDDGALKGAIGRALELARRKPDNPETMRPVKPPQLYTIVEAALPSAVNFGPAERAAMVRRSVGICEKKGVLGAGYIPKLHWTTALANSEGLFAYHRFAEAGFILTCRTPDGTGSGWAGTTGARDVSQIDPVQLTEVAADKALNSRNPRAIEPGDYTVILEPRAAARYLALVLDSLEARAAEEGRSFMSGAERGRTKLGEKVFGEQVTLRSAIGNPILRGSPIGPDGLAARDVTWIEKGVVRTLFNDRFWAQKQGRPATPTAPGMSLVMNGGDLTVDEMIRTTKRGLLVTFFWYIRPVDPMILLHTGMTRDGLFLIENGEIAGPVQNFRWNESPAVSFNRITGLGRPVRMHTGESYDNPAGTALVPAMRLEEFTMTSVSPAV